MPQDWGEARIVNPRFMFGNNTIVRKSVVQVVGGYGERLGAAALFRHPRFCPRFMFFA